MSTESPARPVPAAYVFSRDLSAAAETLACLVADLADIQAANSTTPDAIYGALDSARTAAKFLTRTLAYLNDYHTELARRAYAAQS